MIVADDKIPGTPSTSDGDGGNIGSSTGSGEGGGGGAFGGGSHAGGHGGGDSGHGGGLRNIRTLLKAPGLTYVDMGMQDMIDKLEALDKTKIRAGVVGAEASKSASSGRISVAEAAMINHFGSKKAHIPPRHFIVIPPELAKHEGEKIMKVLMAFGNVDAAMDAAGEVFAEHMRDIILRGELEGNTASTIDKKGFDHPLMDTSALLGAIGHQLVRGNGDVVEGGAATGGVEAFEISGG